MTATEYVILVDAHDQEIGLAEKLAAHQQCLLHRAFSVFIFRDANEPELLLQQRALGKYHSPGLWTNTCCSHPRANENIIKAGERRLAEEMGIRTTLSHHGWFHYEAHFSNGLAENEIDHVLVGNVENSIQPILNPAEAHAYRWITITALQQALHEHPEQFTPWLPQALALVIEKS